MKAEFDALPDLRDWLKNTVNPMKYDLYFVMSDRRVIAIKNVSTEPQIHGYVDDVDPANVELLAEDLSVSIDDVRTFEWEHTRTENIDDA